MSPFVLVNDFPPVASAMLCIVLCSPAVFWNHFALALANPFGLLFIVEPLWLASQHGRYH